MQDGKFRLEARPIDDPDTVDMLNGMIARIQSAERGPYRDAMIEVFMREMRKAMRRGLLEGGEEMIEREGDPYYEEDELDD